MYSVKQSKGSLSERARTMLFSGLWILLLGIPSGLVVYGGFFQEVPEVEANMYALEVVEGEDVSLPWPSEGAAAVGAEGYGVLATSEEVDEPIPIASISKLFVALAVMQERPFAPGEDGARITMSQADEDSYNDYVSRGGSAYPVNAGQQFTQQQAMEALLIPSANNMADTLATWAFGSVEGYLDYANAMVADMGLENTTLADASGFSPDSVSTPAELVLAGQAALENEVIAGIVSQSQAQIYPGVETVYSTNQIINDPSIVGIKTGTTDEAGANLLFAARHTLTESSQTTIVSAIMGQPDRTVLYEEAQSVVAGAYQGVGFGEVLEEEAVVGEYQAPWMDEAIPIISAGGAIVPAWTGANLTPVAEAEPLQPGNAPGEQIGTATIQHGSDSTAVPLVTQGSVPEPSFWWKVTNVFSR